MTTFSPETPLYSKKKNTNNPNTDFSTESATGLYKKQYK